MATFDSCPMDREKIPCRYYKYGCDVTLLASERLAHQKMCIYKYIGCPFPSVRCKWQGKAIETAEHLTTVHRLNLLRGETAVFVATGIDSPINVHWVMLQSCFHMHFLLVLIRRKNRHGVNWFYAAAQLVGSRCIAVGFNCRMEMIRVGGSVSWEGRPRSLEDDVNMPADEFEYFIFDNDTALMYAKDNELHIKVTISMTE